MLLRSRPWPALALLALCACCKDDPAPPASTSSSLSPSAQASSKPPASASAAPSASAPKREGKPPAPIEVSATAADGLALSGSLYRSPAQGAPLVVALHRLSGSREEWGPMVSRLFALPQPPSVLTLDLRGHGRSTTREKGKGTVLWSQLEKKDADALAADVLASVASAEGKLGGKAAQLILVGTDLGATVAALVAAKEPRATSLALISPVAAIRGIDVHKPFSQVRARSSFLASGEHDPISKEPMKALTGMARSSGTVKLYPGNEHGAVFLSPAHPTFWDDLVGFLANVTQPSAQAPGPG